MGRKPARRPPSATEPLPGAAPPPNVWAEPRNLFFFRTGRLSGPDGESICEIMALAETGAVLRAEAALGVGDSCTLEVNSAHSMQARVAWAEANLLGLQLTNTRQVRDILSRRETSFPYRAPRLRLAATLQIRLGAQHLQVRCRDISESGMKVEIEEDISGASAQIDLEGVGNLEGQVRWWSNGKAGISFVRPIPSETFTRWVTDRLESRAG
ncbi:MAG TPA: PilZ domain-containing protein [Allosphingosinicella sp.]